MCKFFKSFQSNILAASLLLFAASCQKMDRPGVGDFNRDPENPGGTLNFYSSFDGTTQDPVWNALDSIKANFPASNPLTLTTGVSGRALQGENKKYVKYAKPNDWAIRAKSFTVSFWIKRDGQTKNNAGTNGPEYPFSLKSSTDHWSGTNMMVLLEGNNAATAVKVVVVDKNKADNWFTWEGGNTVAGLLDNQWHHLAFVYDATTSGMTFYKDGVANPHIPKWGTHGNINIDNSTISELRIGAGPMDKFDTDDWQSSTWKGALDQFRMYSVALPASEIATLHARKM